MVRVADSTIGKLNCRDCKMKQRCARIECLREFEPKVRNQIYCCAACYRIENRKYINAQYANKKAERKEREYFYKRSQC